MSTKPLLTAASLLPGRESMMRVRTETPTNTAGTVSIAAPAPAEISMEPDKKAKVLGRLKDAQRWMGTVGLAKLCGLAPSAALYQLQRLEESGDVQRRGKSRATEWAIAGLAGADQKRAAAPAPAADVKAPKRKHAPPKAAKKAKRRKPHFRRAKAPATSRIPLERPIRKQPSGAPHFGYFSDGSLSIECSECQGKLTQDDLRALRAFTSRFEKSEARS